MTPTPTVYQPTVREQAARELTTCPDYERYLEARVALASAQVELMVAQTRVQACEHNRDVAEVCLSHRTRELMRQLDFGVPAPGYPAAGSPATAAVVVAGKGEG